MFARFHTFQEFAIKADYQPCIQGRNLKPEIVLISPRMPSTILKFLLEYFLNLEHNINEINKL